MTRLKTLNDATGAPDGNIRLFCKGSDSKVLASLRPEAGGGKADAGGLKAATHENLHIFATHVRAVHLGSRVPVGLLKGFKGFQDFWELRYSRSFSAKDGEGVKASM